VTYHRELDCALRLAREAGHLALGYWRRGLQAEQKPDDSPVTLADRAAEGLIVAGLEEAFPGDGLLGEEGGAREGMSGRRWIIDPIDGTRDFVRGSRTWAVMLALEAAGDVVLGVCHLPALGDTYWAVRGGGAFENGEPIHVSSIAELSRAVLCFNDFAHLTRCPFAPQLAGWMARFWAVRNPGGSPGALLVAAGRADAWIEPNAQPWDLAPLKIIAEEAGAVFSNFDGGRSISAGDGFICTPALEAELRRFLAPPGAR
jgi:histidinol phosphatase-like enzyme (inositol monophosphatase family)